MTKYRVLAESWRVEGNKGLRRVVPRPGFDVAAWPAHLARRDTDKTLCGLDTAELREFNYHPKHVDHQDRCEQCFDLRA